MTSSTRSRPARPRRLRGGLGRRTACALGALTLLGLSVPAAADEERSGHALPDLEVAGGRRLGPEPWAPEAEFASTFSSVIEPGVRGAAGQDLASLLGQSLGVRARSMGGLDSFSTLSLRGSSGSQVTVMLDGVPLNSGATGTVDLATLPLEGVERIEVYRGGAPAHLGGQAIGGVVNLVSRTPGARRGASTQLRVGTGSFGTWDASLGRVGVLGRDALRYRVGAWWRRTRGDFEYRDDNGTPLRADDDETVPRRNNDSERLGGMGRVAWRWGGTRLAAHAQGAHRDAGVPGLGSTPALHSRLTTTSGVVELSASRRRPLLLTGRLFANVQRDRFVDPEGETLRPGAAPGESDDRTVTVGGLANGLLPLTRWLHIGGALDLRSEAMRSGGDEPRRSRTVLGAALAPELRWFGGRLVLAPALRADLLRSDLGNGVLDSEQLLLSPRVGLALKLAPWTLKTNLGRYQRTPTFFELFGARGSIWGNPELEPEEGTSVDAGALLDLPLDGWLRRVRLEAVLFHREVDHLITWAQTSQDSVQAVNYGAARLRGYELAASAELPWGTSLRAAYAYLDATNRSLAPEHEGRQLPMRPAHDLDVEAGWACSWASLAYRVSFVSGSFTDAANLHPLPDRLLHGVTFWLRPVAGGPRLLLEATNLLDHRVEDVPLARGGASDPRTVPAAVSDFIGHPLPGRALYAAVVWKAGS